MLRSWVVLIILALTLIFADRVVGLQFLRAPVQRVVQPIEYGLRETGQKVWRGIRFVSSLPFVYQENQRLQKKLKEYYSAQLKVKQLRTENRALREQLKVAGDNAKRQTLAKVLGSDPQRGSAFLVVDKGLVNGVSPDQTASVEGQLVGRIVSVGEQQSVIETIYAVSGNVPVKIGDDLGVLRGEFGFNLWVKELLQEAEVKKDDLVVTSGVGGVYKPDLLVGKVKELKVRENEPFKSARVTPLWQPAELSSIFIE